MGTHAVQSPRSAIVIACQATTPWFRRQSRRAVKLLWWTLTAQLFVQYRYWRRAQRARRLAPVTTEVASRLIHAVDPRDIHIPRDADPAVSVIIPGYGKVEYRLLCLASIAANLPEAAIEVIVVDDATPDGSTNCLAEIDGIRLVVNPRILASCAPATPPHAWHAASSCCS